MQIVLEKRGLTRLIIIKWKFFAGYGKDTFSRDIPYTKKISSLSYLMYLRLIKRVAVFSTLFFFSSQEDYSFGLTVIALKASMIHV